MENKTNFYNLRFDDLKNFLTEKVGVDSSKVKMRAQQIFSAVYKKGKGSETLAIYITPTAKKMSKRPARLKPIKR